MVPRWKTLVLVMAVGSIGAGPGVSARTDATAPAPAVRAEAQAQQETQTTAQLLQEVRALRVAIERMTAAGTRAQLLFGRLQLQEQRLTSLGRQLQETRTKLGDVRRERENQARTIESLTESADRASTPQQRLEMENALKHFKVMVAQLDQQVTALQGEDAGLSQALSAEQARWIELNSRLEELESLLATPKP